MWQATRLPSGVVEHWALADPDALLDDLTQAEFDRNDGRMPYWAVLWPSAMALATAVLGSEFPAGRRVLDLGCGLGLAGLAALHRGSDVTFLDWPGRFCRTNNQKTDGGGGSGRESDHRKT